MRGGREGITGTGGLGSENLPPYYAQRLFTGMRYFACVGRNAYSRIETWWGLEESTVVNGRVNPDRRSSRCYTTGIALFQRGSYLSRNRDDGERASTRPKALLSSLTSYNRYIAPTGGGVSPQSPRTINIYIYIYIYICKELSKVYTIGSSTTPLNARPIRG